ncbi:hypothetical protein Aduo_003263 [Ancylostoma duodenale]
MLLKTLYFQGFFRRTVLRDQKFTCRFKHQCVVDKSMRCACRCCRFNKCVRVGMKREAIQFERDPTGGSPSKRSRVSPAPGPEQGTENQTPVIAALMDMEHRVNQGYVTQNCLVKFPYRLFVTIRLFDPIR